MRSGKNTNDDADCKQKSYTVEAAAVTHLNILIFFDFEHEIYGLHVSLFVLHLECNVWPYNLKGLLYM